MIVFVGVGTFVGVGVFVELTLVGVGVTGDVNNDNKIDILDYNILVGCFGSKLNSDTCGTKKVDADLNDDSLVDGVDYNLFILGLKTTKQGD